MNSLRIRVAAILLACVVLTALVHVRAMSGPFQFDDERDIVERSGIREGPWAAMASSPYRAVTYFTYYTDWKAGNGAPLPFHLTNLLLHLICTSMIFLLILIIFVKDNVEAPLDNQLDLWLTAATIGTLLFAIHPLSVSNVAYISGRAGLLAALFSLIAIWLYFRRPFRLWLIPALVSFVLALFSKEDAAALPLILLAMEYARKNERKLINVAPFFLLATGYGAARLFSHVVVLGEEGGPSWGAHIALAPYVWMRLAMMTLWPVGLSADHHLNAIRSAGDWRLWIPSLLILVAVVGVVSLWLRDRKQALWPVWFAVALLPATAMPLADPLAENRIYFALAGISVFAGVLIYAQIRALQFRRMVMVCSVLVLVMFMPMTSRQEKIWSGQMTLWSDAARKAPDSTRPWDNVALIKFRQRDLRGATFAIKRTLKLDPKDAVAWNILGLISKDRGLYQDALRAYDRAIALNPSLPKVRTNRASLLMAVGKITESERGYREALSVDPFDGDAHYGLGFLYYHIGRYAEAEKHLREALQINPKDDEARELFGKLMQNK